MLSSRQIDLLNAIISEYLDTSEPVGSSVIVKKYNVKCSAATVRNEMAKLLDDGFLQMLHTSSGRVPTPQAYKFFIDEIMEEQEIPVLQEVAIKQRLWPTRFEFNKLLRQSALSLADMTKLLALVTTEDGYVAHAGAVNVLDNIEFWDIDVAKSALYLLDRYELLQELLEKASYGSNDVKFLIGEELGSKYLNNCSLLFSPYVVGNRSGYVGVLGPARMNYSVVVPAVRYTKKLIEELGENW